MLSRQIELAVGEDVHLARLEQPDAGELVVEPVDLVEFLGDSRFASRPWATVACCEWSVIARYS